MASPRNSPVLTDIDRPLSPIEPSEHSYGIVPIRLLPSFPPGTPLTTATTQVFMIHQRSRRAIGFYWGFPKGHPEPHDATPMDTALRELKEETGLEIRGGKDVLIGTDVQNCWFVERYRNPVEGWVKEVRYWIGLVETGTEGGGDRDGVTIQGKELVDAKWCSWEEARGLAELHKTQDMLAKITRFLDGEK
jgi:bis(5'-nucleosidyl)-tetraphosphatase